MGWLHHLAHACYFTGTFYARERLPVLFQFVREALQNDWLPFELRASGGQRLVEDEALALNECGLVSWGCAPQVPGSPSHHWGLVLSQCLGFPPIRWGGDLSRADSRDLYGEGGMGIGYLSEGSLI